jgi:hypothetical protein
LHCNRSLPNKDITILNKGYKEIFTKNIGIYFGKLDVIIFGFFSPEQ